MACSYVQVEKWDGAVKEEIYRQNCEWQMVLHCGMSHPRFDRGRLHKNEGWFPLWNYFLIRSRAALMAVLSFYSALGSHQQTDDIFLQICCHNVEVPCTMMWQFQKPLVYCASHPTFSKNNHHLQYCRRLGCILTVCAYRLPLTENTPSYMRKKLFNKQPGLTWYNS